MKLNIFSLYKMKSLDIVKWWAYFLHFVRFFWDYHAKVKSVMLLFSAVLLNVVKVYPCQWQNLEIDNGAISTAVWMYFMPLNWQLKMIRMANFMLAYIEHSFLNLPLPMEVYHTCEYPLSCAMAKLKYWW